MEFIMEAPEWGPCPESGGQGCWSDARALSGAVVQRAQALDELLAVNWGDRTMED